VPLYVLALTDVPVMPWQEDDGRRIESTAIDSVYVVGEHRATAPAISEAELHRQHSIVQRIADAVPAVIPARFGSLLEEAELAAILQHRRELVKTTLDHVRGAVQMTLRIAGVSAAPPDRVAASGREYLQRRRDELTPSTPPHAEPTVRKLRGLILDERRTAGERGTLNVYHLIRREDVKEYRDSVTAAPTSGIALSGPFAPFAFAPDLFA
jgi:hypothetical protein